MINPDQLHAFLEKIDQGVVAVDLLKIGQYHAKQQFSCKLCPDESLGRSFGID